MTTIKERLITLKPLFLAALTELVSIRSVIGPALPGAPFGAGIHRALTYLLTLAQQDGFVVKNTDGYGGHIEFPGLTEEIVAVVGHLDVVSEGAVSEWTTPPFEADIRNGYIYGRGVIDDKGPLLSCYYAMKALKDCGFVPSKTIRLILGCDEETDWKGMEYYLQRERTPVCGFSPDGDFPVVHGEMGLLTCDLVKHFEPSSAGETESCKVHLISFTGGSAPNVTADTAVIVLECGPHTTAVAAYLTAYGTARPGYPFSSYRENNCITIEIRGKAAHGASPEKGLNAISIGFDLLAGLPFLSSDALHFVKFYSAHIGFDFHGERIGCSFSDEPSGELILNVGIIDWHHSECRLTLNIRYPVTSCEVQVYTALEAALAGEEVLLECLEHLPPLYLKTDHPLVTTLLDVYRRHTEDTTTPPLVTAGATYARAIPNTLAFGPLFPGEPNPGHQVDECVSTDRLMLSAVIYADAIRRLSQ